MQKLIIDTNVIVSALISRNGIPARIIDDLVLEDKVIWCVSDDVLQEYLEVLNRDKFQKIKDFSRNAEIILSYLDEFGLAFEPQEKFEVIKDLSDNKFLELAVVAAADFIITGNTNDFTFDEFREVKIMTPTQYWNEYKPL